MTTSWRCVLIGIIFLGVGTSLTEGPGSGFILMGILLLFFAIVYGASHDE